MSTPPRIPWANLENDLRRHWNQGQHVTIVAPTGHGKTHLALSLAEMSNYVLVLATKRRDPLVQDLSERGYQIVQSPDEILWTETEPLNPRVVVWPHFPETGSRNRQKLQADALREVLDWADKTENWTILADETMWLNDHLRLERELAAIWQQGRTQGLSMVASMQRPSRVPRLAFSQASYLFIGKYTDKRDIDALREISSVIPRELVENGIRSLSKERHEFLYVDCVHDNVAIVVAPER